MKRFYLKLNLFLFVVFSAFGASAQVINVLVVTGGHEFEQEPFQEMLNSIPEINWDEAVQPKANQLIEDGRADEYDVFVFYDMYQEITEQQKLAFQALLEKGKPMLFLHHSIVSYQNWDEFRKIIGGKYYEERLFIGKLESGYSNYKHDVNVPVKLIGKSHPVLAGLLDFELYDEVYGNTEVLSSVKPLLETNHPNSSRLIGWENKYKASTIIYLQPGHGKETYQDGNYRQLLRQSINYLNATNYTN